MAKEELLTFTGIVTTKLPNASFKVKLPNEMEILCVISGNMRRHKIWVQEGDSVEVEMTPYDLTRGRIVKRL